MSTSHRPLAIGPSPSPRPDAARAKPPPLPSARERPPIDPHADRRAHRRLGIQLEVGFLGHDNFYTGFTEDISEGGLFVATYALLPIGTEIDLDFVLPEGSEVHARCVVRWVRDPRNTDSDTPPGMGLQFLELSEAHRHRIEAFTKHREPIFYED